MNSIYKENKPRGTFLMVCQNREEYSKKIEKILSKMSVEEKVAQMQQLSANATPEDIFNNFKAAGKIGSYLHVLGEETGGFLESAAQTELKIPPIFGIDAIHGHSLLKAATTNLKKLLVENMQGKLES